MAGDEHHLTVIDRKREALEGFLSVWESLCYAFKSYH
jgi:hypothetical protein